MRWAVLMRREAACPVRASHHSARPTDRGVERESRRQAGDKLSKTVLADLKKLDQLAKAGDKEGVPAVSAALKGHVLEFVALEPQRLADKFGVDDL